MRSIASGLLLCFCMFATVALAQDAPTVPIAYALQGDIAEDTNQQPISSALPHAAGLVQGVVLIPRNDQRWLASPLKRAKYGWLSKRGGQTYFKLLLAASNNNQNSQVCVILVSQHNDLTSVNTYTVLRDGKIPDLQGQTDWNLVILATHNPARIEQAPGTLLGVRARPGPCDSMTEETPYIPVSFELPQADKLADLAVYLATDRRLYFNICRDGQCTPRKVCDRVDAGAPSSRFKVTCVAPAETLPARRFELRLYDSERTPAVRYRLTVVP